MCFLAMRQLRAVREESPLNSFAILLQFILCHSTHWGGGDSLNKELLFVRNTNHNPCIIHEITPLDYVRDCFHTHFLCYNS